MARSVYSLRIYSGVVDPAAGIVGPIVPAGLIYIVRDIDINGVTGAVGDVMTVQNPTLGNLFIVRVTTARSGDNWQWRGRQVYAEGEKVGSESFVGTFHVCISGYMLTLP